MSDPLHLLDVDHLRFYVGNAKQVAFFYAHTFGFRVHQFADLTTGSREHASYLLTQGNIRIVLTTGLNKEHPAQEDVALFGDGVKDIAFTVEDAEAAYKQALKNGAESAYEPIVHTDDNGTIVRGGVKTYGRVVHSFVSRRGGYKLGNGGPFMPQFVPMNFTLNDYNEKHPCGLKFVDHVVGNVGDNQMDVWVKWYEDILGFKLFKHFDDKDISTEYTALMSKVLDSGYGVIKMPINEPAEGKRKSQIQEYLEWHNMTAGVQHVALRTDDELSSVAELRRRGLDFLFVPDAYYKDVWKRIEGEMGVEVKEDHQRIKELGILIDADEEGYLLQLFTMPLQDRPTLFFEIICRRGSQSFGKGNFKALFEALESEQARRGNL